MKTRLLILGPSQNGRVIGGIDSTLEFFFENTNLFYKKGYEISYINSNQLKRKNDNYGNLNISNILNSLIFFKKVFNNVFKKNPDIIHFHSSTSTSLLRDQLLILALYLLKKIKKNDYKILIQIHSNIKIAFGKNLIHFLNKYFFNMNIHYPILLCQDSFKDFNNYKKYKFFINNISFTNLNENKKSIKKTNNLLEIIFIGSVSLKKGIIDLINALIFLDPSKYRLKIIGEFNDNSFKKKVFELIEKYNYLNITFLGKKIGVEKNNLLSESDLFVLPSYTEGMPISILEAMKFGNAIISTNVGCIGSLIKNHAILINPGEINILRNEIAKFIHYPEHLAFFKNKSCQYSKKNDKKKIYFNNIVKIYTETKTLI